MRNKTAKIIELQADVSRLTQENLALRAKYGAVLRVALAAIPDTDGTFRVLKSDVDIIDPSGELRRAGEALDARREVEAHAQPVNQDWQPGMIPVVQMTREELLKLYPPRAAEAEIVDVKQEEPKP